MSWMSEKEVHLRCQRTWLISRQETGIPQRLRLRGLVHAHIELDRQRGGGEPPSAGAVLPAEGCA